MTEREIYFQKSAEIVRRLKELGATVPEMPDSDGMTVALCSLCGGRRYRIMNSNESEQVCSECQGLGQIVSNPLIEWNRKLKRTLNEVLDK